MNNKEILKKANELVELLEKQEENHEMPYSYDDMQETIKQTDEILEKLMMRK